MRTTTAGLRYAKALFSLASDEGATGVVRDQLEMLNGFLTESSELRRALLTPLHPASERKAVLNKLADRFDLSPLLRNFILYLIDQRRLIDMGGVAEEFNRLVDEEEGRMSAEVTTATPLDSAHEERLREALSRRTGREVRLEIKVDASLIGGAVAKVGDLVFDGSLRTQLDTLRTHLMKGS
jgi:F-type H+-transporting ATPase subunit delta